MMKTIENVDICCLVQSFSSSYHFVFNFRVDLLETFYLLENVTHPKSDVNININLTILTLKIIDYRIKFEKYVYTYHSFLLMRTIFWCGC